MPRAPTTLDPFTAIAEPKRRHIIETLIGSEMTVSDLVSQTGWSQPSISKHLAVLKEVGLVKERKQGRYRKYQVDASQLKPINDWVHQFEQYWVKTLDNLENYLDYIQSNEISNDK